MKNKHITLLILIVFIFIFTGCLKFNKNNQAENPSNTENNNSDNMDSVDTTDVPDADNSPTGAAEDLSDQTDTSALFPFKIIKDEIAKYGYLNLNGGAPIEPVYYYAGIFHDGLAIVLKNKEDEVSSLPFIYQVIDLTGTVIFENSLVIGDFSNGFAYYSDPENSSLFGYINSKGEKVIAPKFTAAYDFNNIGEAFALTDKKQYVKIDTSGNVIETYKVDEEYISNQFKDGYLTYYDNERNTMGVITLDGTSIIESIYGEITYLGNDLFAAKEKNEDHDTGIYTIEPAAIFNNKGEQLTDYIHYDISPYYGNYASATDNTSTYFIDLDGNKVTDMPTMQGRGTMIALDGVIQADIDNKLAYIDKQGNVKWQYDPTIKLDDGISVHSNKFKLNKYVLVYYPSVDGLEDLQIQGTINNQLKSYFTDNRQSATDDVYLTVSDDFNALLINHLLLIHQTGYDYYLGAAHGMPISNYYCIDTKTGTFYQLSDLFLKDSNYVEKINDFIKDDISKLSGKKDSFYYINDFKSIADNQLFYVTKDALIIYFTPYDIAAFAAGFPEFSITFDKLSDELDTKGDFWTALHE